MKALLINPEKKVIETVDIGSADDIAKLIGFDTIISDEIDPGGDRLYFDEECFLRAIPGRFQIDNLVPVSGKAVIAGTADDEQTIKDAVSDLDSINERIKYL